MLIMVDLSGLRNLKLNASRDRIIINEEWTQFEEDLAWLICRELKKKPNGKQWSALQKLLADSSVSEAFERGLKRAE